MTQYDRFWADYLGLAPSDWDEPGLSVRAHRGLAGYLGLWCFRRNERITISAPPGWVEWLTRTLDSDRAEQLMQESVWRGMLRDDFVRFVGPAFQGWIDSDGFRPAHDEKVRFVSPDDAAAVERFRSECRAEDWETSGLDRVTRTPAASFDGPRIVAMAGYRAWSDTAGDPCVLTDPACRGTGRGAAVVSAIVGSALEDGKTLLYQTLETNEAAVRLAFRLGYRRYASHVAVRLQTETPSELIEERTV